MLRFPIKFLALLAVSATIIESTSSAQQDSVPDRVYFRDKKDGIIKDYEAVLKVSPTGYQVVSASSKKLVATVSAEDLVRVVPGKILNFTRTEIYEPVNFEIKKDWEKARAGHSEILKKAVSAPEKVRRYLEFRVAICSAHAADEAADEATAQAKSDDAIKLLDNYLAAYKSGWEAWPVAQTCARFRVTSTVRVKEGDKEIERRMFDEAARTWSKLARTDLAADLKLDARLQEIDCRIRARQPADAKALLDEAAKTAPAGPSKDRLAIYQLGVKYLDKTDPAEGIAAIEAAIAKNSNPLVRATAFGMMGELYLNAKKPREAMWKFLSVVVVYNQDRDEVIKAMSRLSDTFRDQGDEERAKSFKEQARRLRTGL